jgi:glycerol-3-phosphate acyltransferase PlsY
MIFICIAFAIVVPYLICSINPAIIVTRIKSGEDIKKLGSGSAGLTNTLRTQGKTAALIVLLGDVLKGVASVLLVVLFCNVLWQSQGFHDILCIDCGGCSSCNRDYPYTRLSMWIASLSGVLGHCFPVYYKFKGGKAVLVTAATGMTINWLPPLMAIALFITLIAITRYVSVGSIFAAIFYPISVWFVGVHLWQTPDAYIGVIFSSVIAVILIFMHRQNIVRLINKNEKKLGVSERKDKKEKKK